MPPGEGEQERQDGHLLLHPGPGVLEVSGWAVSAEQAGHGETEVSGEGSPRFCSPRAERVSYTEVFGGILLQPVFLLSPFSCPAGKVLACSSHPRSLLPSGEAPASFSICIKSSLWGAAGWDPPPVSEEGAEPAAPSAAQASPFSGATRKRRSFQPLCF